MVYYIDYIDSSGDVSHVWVNASSKEEAKKEAKREYHDIKEIIRCYSINN